MLPLMSRRILNTVIEQQKGKAFPIPLRHHNLLNFIAGIKNTYYSLRNATSLANKPIQSDSRRKEILELRHSLPEFLPDPNVNMRNLIREKLERNDMIARRHQIDIPEFYVGEL